MTEAEMYVLWSYAREAWPNYPLPVEGSDAERMRATVWMDEFAEIPAAAIREALRSPDIARREWFPPLGLIRDAAVLSAALARGDRLPPDADEAWTEIGRQIRAVGHMGIPEWSHPAVAESVEAMGWRVLCLSDEGDVAVRAQWRSFYDLARGRALRRLVPPPAAALKSGTRALGR